jgi:hypothetical protein
MNDSPQPVKSDSHRFFAGGKRIATALWIRLGASIISRILAEGEV